MSGLNVLGTIPSLLLAEAIPGFRNTMVLAASAEYGLRRDVMYGHDRRIHRGIVDFRHILEDPQLRLKDKAPFIRNEQIPGRLELLRFPLSPWDENAFLEGPVELHGGDGCSGRGTGHPLNRDLGSRASSITPSIPDSP